MTSGLVHAFNAAGHRASYRDFLSSCLELDPVTGQIDAAMAARLIGANQLLFATVSPGTASKAVLIALVRASLGKRTSAICMGEGWCRDKNHPVRTAFTQWLYRFLDATGRFKVFTIIPYELAPGQQRMTSDWILDLSLWDLPEQFASAPVPETRLSKRVVDAAGRRAIVVFLGRATPRKGYRELTNLSRSIGSRALIVSAGIVSDNCRPDADTLRANGMIVEDRRISEEELISLYGVADYVWCRYDEASCSMSSGIFGRAVQLGRTAIVPAGTYLERLARLLDHPIIHDLDAQSLAASNPSTHQAGRKCTVGGSASSRLNAMAEVSLQKLAGSL